MKTIAVLFCFLTADVALAHDPGARYPTPDEAFYVLSCMEMNGRDADGLRKCSCAINAIEGQLPYEQYSEAVLVFAMRQAGTPSIAEIRRTLIVDNRRG